MIDDIEPTQESINAFCKKIGLNRLLVQGAGGNVSWKEGCTLWIKASGTWLSDAETKEIFVPVDLTSLHKAIFDGNFSEAPKVIGESSLKPSIETLLHGIMPHKIVAHLHMVDPLAIMVLKDAENIIKDLVGKSLKWTQVDYFKPGPDLAAAVHQAIDSNPKVDILFLKNHGIVIGGDSIAAIEAIIEALSSSLKRGVVNECALGPSVLSLREIPEAYRQIYSYIDDSDVQSLVLESKYFHRVVNDWALYPDHVVFLGPKAFIYDSWVDFLKRENVETLPDLIFIKNIGVLALKSFSKAKYAQILNFFDVISRLSEEDVARPLSKSQVDELLNWDAEKYRLGLQKK